MTNPKEEIKELSPESLAIANRIRTAMLDRGNPAVTPAKLDEYLLFCEETLNLEADKVITDAQAEYLMESLKIHSRLARLFPPNHRCVVAIIPVDRYGNPLQQSDIDNGNHIVRLAVEPKPVGREARTVDGFTGDSSFVHKVLPPEFLEHCSFEIGDYNEVEDEFAPYDMEEKVRKEILAKFGRALKNAQSIFNRGLLSAYAK
jgi:hypothetical protein